MLVEFNRYVEKCFQNFAEVVVLNDINQPNVSRRLIYRHALERLVLQNLTCRWSQLLRWYLKLNGALVKQKPFPSSEFK